MIGKLVDDNYKIKDNEQFTRGRLKLDQIETITLIKEIKKSDIETNEDL